MAGQMLFTAGHSLTMGGFFYYFVYEFDPSPLFLAAVQIAPETSGSLSVFARQLAVRVRNRKGIWIVSLLLARFLALLIPLALLWPATADSRVPMTWILLCTIGWYLCQGVAYVCYISWLSDLVPQVNWGRLFARRRIASLLISVTVPIAAGLIRSYYIQDWSDEAQRWSYAVIFLCGGILAASSLLPMLHLPDVPWRNVRESTGRSFFEVVWSSRSLQLLLASRWWLAFFQGLTQTAFFKYQVDILRIELETYYLLTATMLLLQLPMSWLGGWLSDRDRDKPALMTGMVLVSFSLGFWILAKPDSWWLLFGAYGMWSLFGVINICGRNLCLKLSPEGDNSGQYALYQQVGGLIAGLSGLLGGWWLNETLPATTGMETVRVYQTIFLVSALGRLTAPLWLLGVRGER
jgi:Na+/melibiose symporter-like transporter